MKNAYTMFYELGFKLYGSNEEILVYSLKTTYSEVFISFDLELKSYNTRKWIRISNRWQEDDFSVNPNLHNAIHQQMIELGWI